MANRKAIKVLPRSVEKAQAECEKQHRDDDRAVRPSARGNFVFSLNPETIREPDCISSVPYYLSIIVRNLNCISLN